MIDRRTPKTANCHRRFLIRNQVAQISSVALCILLGAPGLAQQTDQANVEDSSVVYATDKLVTINIRLDPDDWHALRISHRTMDAEKIAEDPYVYYKADVEINGRPIKSVGVRKKGFFGSVVSTRPSASGHRRFDSNA